MQRILIDGDAPNAQKLGEALQVSGYPTVLVLLPDGTQGARINESLSFGEFADTLRAFMKTPKALSTRVREALKGPVTADDWLVLSQTRWEADASAPQIGIGACANTSAVVELARRAPAHLPAQALLTFAAIPLADECKEPLPQKNTLAHLLAQILSGNPQGRGLSGDRLISLRSALVQNWDAAQSLLSTLPSSSAEPARAQWLKALEALAEFPEHQSLSVLDRLRAMSALVDTEKQRTKSVSSATRTSATALTQRALKSDLTLYGRRALVTEAIYLLGQVDAYDEAKQALTDEIKRSDPSWHHYLYSAWAALESEQGHKEEASTLSKKAQSAASGRATRLQWTVSDTVRTLKQSTSLEKAKEKIEAVYQIGFTLEDPFYGRNAKRMQMLQSELAKRNDLSAIQDIMSRYGAKCVSMPDTTQLQRCREHFDPLLSKLSSK